MKHRSPRSRSQVRHGETRFERTARERSRRAQAHLERTRQRNRAQETPTIPRRAWIGVCFAASLGIGLLLSSPAIEHALAMTDAAPQIAWIQVIGNERLAALDIANATGLAKGGPLQAVDPEAVETRLARHPWIREARVVGLPNGTVVVHVEERVPAAVFFVDETPARLVDADGVAFAVAESPDDDLLSLHAPGDVAPEALRKAVALGRRIASDEGLAALGRFEISMPAGPAAGYGWRLAVASSGALAEVVLGRAPFDDQLARLARLLAEARDDALAARSIDLRFADQAVLRTRLAS